MNDKNLSISAQADTRQMIAALQERLQRFAVARRGDDQVVSAGCAELDRRLPHGGLRRGTLIEWLTPGPGSGAGSLALAAARQASRESGPLVVIDPAGSFYPPAAVQAGLALEQLILVRPPQQAEQVWALDRSLRTPGVAAVLSWVDRFPPRVWRRMQLAAETAGTLALLIRPAQARGDPSWADIRFLVTPLPSHTARRVRVELLRLRGSPGGHTLDLELDDETGVVRLAPPLAAAAVVSQSGASQAARG